LPTRGALSSGDSLLRGSALKRSTRLLTRRALKCGAGRTSNTLRRGARLPTPDTLNRRIRLLTGSALQRRARLLTRRALKCGAGRTSNTLRRGARLPTHHTILERGIRLLTGSAF
jgi:hypothetical protein